MTAAPDRAKAIGTRGRAPGLAAAAAALVAFYAALHQIGAPSEMEKETLRAAFRLPPDVTLSEIRIDRKKHAPFAADIEGVAELSAAQLDSYAAAPGPAGGWSDLDARSVAWGGLSEARAQAARRGRRLCFVESTGRETRAVSPCGGAQPATGDARLVQGLIDFDRRTLHMLIRPLRAAGPSRLP